MRGDVLANTRFCPRGSASTSLQLPFGSSQPKASPPVQAGNARQAVREICRKLRRVFFVLLHNALKTYRSAVPEEHRLAADRGKGPQRHGSNRRGRPPSASAPESPRTSSSPSELRLREREDGHPADLRKCQVRRGLRRKGLSSVCPGAPEKPKIRLVEGGRRRGELYRSTG